MLLLIISKGLFVLLLYSDCKCIMLYVTRSYGWLRLEGLLHRKLQKYVILVNPLVNCDTQIVKYE